MILVVCLNPAIDAMSAALARGLAAGARWPAILADATAVCAAAVAVDVAGEIDLRLAGKTRPAVKVGVSA